MDEYFETSQGPNPVLLRRMIFNILTAIFVLASVVLGGAYVTVLLNPQIPLNPYPPPTLPPTVGPPTPTQTAAIRLPTEIPPTDPPTFRPLPSATFTPTPTATVAPTRTPELTPPSTAEAGAEFEVQPGSPTYIPDERGCAFMGVGGRVFDRQSAPIVGLAVRMGGELGGLSVGTLDTLTNNAQDRFGFGGYYFELSDTPVASEQTLWIQILDASSGLPLSDKVFIDTFAGCDQNLVLMNWRQTGG